jgi:hypothetical protein
MDMRPEEMVVSEDFDGTPIASIEARLPAFVVEMPQGYKRGTHLKMEIEFRVRSVRYEENRKGELTHQMVLAVEEVELKRIVSPNEEVTLLGAIESDGIPTDYGQSSEDDPSAASEDDPDPEWCEEHQRYGCDHSIDLHEEIEGQESIDLGIWCKQCETYYEYDCATHSESSEKPALVPDTAWESKGPQGPLSALDAGF